MWSATTPVMDEHERATSAQRVGIFLALVEGVMFAFMSAMHLGVQFRLGAATFSAPFIYPAGITEAAISLALLLGVLMPGPGRSGRVLAAQLAALFLMLAIQVAMMFSASLFSARNEILYVIAFVLSIASLVLVGSPMYRRRRFAH
jgi:hypothetical protein